MRKLFGSFFSLFLIFAFSGQLFAQQTQAAPPTNGTSASSVPRLIKFSVVLLDHQGQPLKGPVGVTFSLYAQQSGAGLPSSAASPTRRLVTSQRTRRSRSGYGLGIRRSGPNLQGAPV